MTDTKLYTGMHANKFDADGKGKGIAGREDRGKVQNTYSLQPPEIFFSLSIFNFKLTILATLETTRARVPMTRNTKWLRHFGIACGVGPK